MQGGIQPDGGQCQGRFGRAHVGREGCAARSRHQETGGSQRDRGHAALVTRRTSRNRHRPGINQTLQIDAGDRALAPWYHKCSLLRSEVGLASSHQ